MVSDDSATKPVANDRMLGMLPEGARTPRRTEQADDGSDEPVLSTEDGVTLVHLPPKGAGTALGVGLAIQGGSWLDPLLRPFVRDLPPPRLVVAQISPESAAIGLLSPYSFQD